MTMPIKAPQLEWDDPEWRVGALCLSGGYDPELWFPVGEGTLHMLQSEDAKAVCSMCPVWRQCREWALTTRQEYGVWGGLSEGDRRRIWRCEAAQRARKARAAS